jgi:hypothetical protein
MPANGIAVDGPELRAVRVGRQIGSQQSDYRERDDDPPVGTILAHAGTHISSGEKRSARQREDDDCEHDQRRVGEGRKAAPSQDRKSEKCGGTESNER